MAFEIGKTYRTRGAPCTDCGGTGWGYQTERYCTCDAGAAFRSTDEFDDRHADAPTPPEVETIWDRDARAALPAVIRQCVGDRRNEGETIEQMFARKAGAIADALAAIRAERGKVTQ